jgi:hypothetical protein
VATHFALEGHEFSKRDTAAMAEGDVNFDAKRENLLDVVLDSLAKQGKTTIITRIIVVTRFAKREQNDESLKGPRRGLML